MKRIESIEERLKFIEAQFGIEFVEASTQEVPAHYRKVQNEKDTGASREDQHTKEENKGGGAAGQETQEPEWEEVSEDE